MSKSGLEELFECQLNIYNSTIKNGRIYFEREKKVCNDRLWRVDFVIFSTDPYVAIEIEGGSWNRGAHCRGKHFQSDCDKYNQIQLNGWKLFRFTGEDVRSGKALNFVIKYVRGEK